MSGKMITEPLPECKLFYCADHGFDYLPFETDDTEDILCPVCGEPMSFECVIP